MLSDKPMTKQTRRFFLFLAIATCFMKGKCKIRSCKQALTCPVSQDFVSRSLSFFCFFIMTLWAWPLAEIFWTFRCLIDSKNTLKSLNFNWSGSLSLTKITFATSTLPPYTKKICMEGCALVYGTQPDLTLFLVLWPWPGARLWAWQFLFDF